MCPLTGIDRTYANGNAGKIMQRPVQFNREWVEFVSLVLVALNHRIRIDFAVGKVRLARPCHNSLAMTCAYILTTQSWSIDRSLTAKNVRGTENDVARAEEPVSAAIDANVE